MISIIIVTYDRIQSVKKCIEGILKQNNNKCEIIVIDNGSNDETYEILEKEYKNVIKLIRNNVRKNLKYCKKVGIENSVSEIIAFIDDDCVPSENWLDCIRSSFSNFDCDILAGPVKSLNNIKLPYWWQDSLNWTIGIADLDNHYFMPLGCNVAFKIKVLKEIELQNEDNFKKADLVYTEDTLRIKTAIKKGYKIRLDNSMVVKHEIDPKKLSFKYIIYRGWLEGNHWAQNERNLKILVIRILALLINPLRFIITLNFNYFLRIIVSLSYIVTFLKEHAHSN